VEKKITVIPAVFPFPAKQRVAICCRVSSKTGAQLQCLAALASYLTKYVMSRFGMQFEDICLDAESGSNTTGRKEFKRMMDDANNGALSILSSPRASAGSAGTPKTLSMISIFEWEA